MCSCAATVPDGHVVQLDPVAGAAEHARGRDGIQRQRQRRARVVVGGHLAARLVVDDDELALAVVEAVDAAR